MQRHLVIMGRPGAGKGTISQKLTTLIPQTYHLALGDCLRQVVNETPISAVGQKIKHYLQVGALVPDEIICTLMGNILSQTAASLVIWDGFPRNSKQATWLVDYFKNHHHDAVLVVWLEITSSQAVTRLSQRVVCPQGDPAPLGAPTTTTCPQCGRRWEKRSDDQSAVTIERQKVYQKQTTPLKVFLTNKYRSLHLDANQPLKKTLQELLRWYKGALWSKQNVF